VVKIKRILVSQPQPAESEKSPYFELAEKFNLKIDFCPFIRVEGVTAREFRQSRIDILSHTGIVFTSKTAIDHFFTLLEELRLQVPDTMKYFCISESVAFYLQKYIVYRKRKIFHGKSTPQELVDILAKHKDEKYFVPMSNQSSQELPQMLEKQRLKYTQAVLYKTVCCEIKKVPTEDYDLLVFYSPSEIKSLQTNFPDFVQGETIIASFGASTAKAVIDAGLRLDIQAPLPEAPSMTMALELFLKEHNKK